MLGIGLGDKSLVVIFKHSGESSIVSIKIFPRVLIHLGLKFPSDMEHLLVEMRIFLSLLLFRPCGRG